MFLESTLPLPAGQAIPCRILVPGNSIHLFTQSKWPPSWCAALLHAPPHTPYTHTHRKCLVSTVASRQAFQLSNGTLLSVVYGQTNNSWRAFFQRWGLGLTTLTAHNNHELWLLLLREKMRRESSRSKHCIPGNNQILMVQSGEELVVPPETQWDYYLCPNGALTASPNAFLVRIIESNSTHQQE